MSRNMINIKHNIFNYQKLRSNNRKIYAKRYSKKIQISITELKPKQL